MRSTTLALSSLLAALAVAASLSDLRPQAASALSPSADRSFGDAGRLRLISLESTDLNNEPSVLGLFRRGRRFTAVVRSVQSPAFVRFFSSDGKLTGRVSVALATGARVRRVLAVRNAYALAIRPHGLALVDRNFNLVRSFAAKGTAFTPGLVDGDATTVVQDDAGRFVLGGTASANTSEGGGSRDLVLAAYDAGGALDAAFGSAGLARLHIDSVDSLQLRSLVRWLDGRYSAVGWGIDRSTRRTVGIVATFTPTGQVDSTFGYGRGYVQVTLDEEPCTGVCGPKLGSRLFSAGLQLYSGKERLIVAGAAGSFSRDFEDGVRVGAGNRDALAAAVRLNADGSLDGGFGRRGRAAMDFRGSTGATALAFSRGRIYLGTGVDSNFAIARLLPNGGADSSFGAAGRACVRPEVDFNDALAQEVALDGSGGVVAAGGYLVSRGEDARASAAAVRMRSRRSWIECFRVSRETRILHAILAVRSRATLQVEYLDEARGRNVWRALRTLSLGTRPGGILTAPWMSRIPRTLRREEAYRLSLRVRPAGSRRTQTARLIYRP